MAMAAAELHRFKTENTNNGCLMDWIELSTHDCGVASRVDMPTKQFFPLSVGA